MLQRGQMSQSSCNYLTADIDRTQQFYLLHKIHRDPHNPPGRPIVSGSGGPTEKISQFVDHFIGPLNHHTFSILFQRFYPFNQYTQQAHHATRDVVIVKVQIG